MGGFFEKTVPVHNIKRPIALLRLDGDLYSSTKVVLEHFYPAVQEGGWVVIDDYDWLRTKDDSNVKWSTIKVCREAVDEYRAAHRIFSPISRKYFVPSWRKKEKG